MHLIYEEIINFFLFCWFFRQIKQFINFFYNFEFFYPAVGFLKGLFFGRKGPSGRFQISVGNIFCKWSLFGTGSEMRKDKLKKLEQRVDVLFFLRQSKKNSW